MAADEGVAGILALRNRADHQARGLGGGEVFVTVDGDVDSVLEQFLLDRLGEPPHASVEGAGSVPVTGRRDLDKLDRKPWIRLLDQGRDGAALQEGELARPSTDPKHSHVIVASRIASEVACTVSSISASL